MCAEFIRPLTRMYKEALTGIANISGYLALT